MPDTISIADAKAHLEELIGQLLPGQEIVITDRTKPVAKLIGQRAMPRRSGSAKGKLGILVDDKAHLEVFKEHM